MSDNLEHQPEHILIDGEAANDYLLDEIDIEDEAGVKINLHENERNDLLDTSDDDPTATLRTMNKDKQVFIWATNKYDDKKKFVPKHRITYRPAVPQPTRI